MISIKSDVGTIHENLSSHLSFRLDQTVFETASQEDLHMSLRLSRA